jgi:general secretion pathway protein G
MSSGTIRGFTLIELVVVLAVVGLLVSLALPRFGASVERSREVVLRQNLAAIRDALDQFNADTGARAQTLDDLVSRRYLREIPLDPLTESRTSWIVVPVPEDSGTAGVFDVRSAALGEASDGTRFGDW